VDAWRTPTIGCHLANEVADCSVNSRSTRMPLPRDHRPVATKSLPMPLCHGVRFDNNQCVRPPRPGRTQRHPERAVCIIKGRSSPLLNKRSHLLTKSYVLNNQVSARAQSRPQDADSKCDKEDQETYHGVGVCRAVLSAAVKIKSHFTRFDSVIPLG